VERIYYLDHTPALTTHFTTRLELTPVPEPVPDEHPGHKDGPINEQVFDHTFHTVRPPFLGVWKHSVATGPGFGFGIPRSTPLWLDGHLVQFFDGVVLEASSFITRPATTPVTVMVHAQPPDWPQHVPELLLSLEASPYRADIAGPEVTTSPDLAHAHAPLVIPLQPITLTIRIASYTGPAELRLYDAHLRQTSALTVQVQSGLASPSVQPRGRAGPQWAVVLVDGRIAGVRSTLWTIDTTTRIATGQADLDRIYPMVRDFMEQDVVSYELDGHPIRGYRSPDNPLLWLRDHVYQGRGFRYFERDMTSALDAFRRAQRPDGSFPDVLTYPAWDVTAHRLETESDLEFLFVQGVYDAWQATGDDDWLRSNLDAMKRGLDYLTTDPQRWNAQYGLVHRPYTIDMWDFQYGPTTRSPEGNLAPRHWIDDQTIWGIFHGDNTGLAYALKLLERMEQHLGNPQEAYRLHDQRNDLMRRLDALCWNGPYFTHFILDNGEMPSVPGVDTAAQLSLSNAYALNREVLSSEQEQAIVETYHARRDFDRAFAEWYSIDPPFPAGSFGMAGGKGEQPGEYVNGGIMPLVGGELARGAFHAGYERYGFDILHRYAELIRLTGASYLWYYPDGRPGISGPHTLATDGWGAGAMLGALIEGAAGVVDTGTRYRDVTLSPRWGATPDVRQVSVVVGYGASDGYVAYRWHYEPEQQRLRLLLTGSWEQAHVRLLLPPQERNAEAMILYVDGTSSPFRKKDVGQGRYVVFDVGGGDVEVELRWEEES
jgi:hypothetical protein